MFNLESRRALQNFHLGFLAARIAEWTYLVTLNWIVLTRFESAFAVGVINACRMWPAVVVSMPSGVLADRYDCRKLLSIINILTGLCTVGVGAGLSWHASLPVLAALVAIRELVANMEPPARNTYLSDLCPDELPRALASNATVLNLGRVVGPLVAGALLIRTELETIFALSVLGMLWAGVATWNNGVSTSRTIERTVDSSMSEALRYVWQTPQIRLLIALMVAPMLLAFPYISLLPLMAKELLNCGPEGVGTLMSLTAVGSLVSSATIIGTSQHVLKGRFQLATLFLFSLSLVAGAVSPNFHCAAIAMFFAGASSQAYRTVSRILVQTGVPRELHGRVVSLVLMDRALIPLGTIGLGWLAEQCGVFSAGLTMGLGTAAATCILVALQPQVLRLRPAHGSDTRPLVTSGRVLTPGLS